MLGKKPLKSQFALTFILIIVVSLIATIITYYTGYIIYTNIEFKKVYPANYYEQKVPEIEAYIRAQGATLINGGKASLDEIIPSEGSAGIGYQLMDDHGNFLYGTDETRLIKDKNDLYQKINTTSGIDGKYVRIVPVFDSQGKMCGAIALSYSLTTHYRSASERILLAPLFLLILFSPFIFIAIFTLIFSRRFAANIGKPVNMLIDASIKVKEKDLDFDIDYSADNELGRLCEAFNEMKNELKTSLISQWKAEQERQEMVQALAHDLKTPLSVIQGYAESLQESGYTDTRRTNKYLQVIKDNAHKGSQLVREMLYAAELETSGAALHIVPVDIYTFLMQKKESYEMIAKNKGINFKVDITCENQAVRTCPIDIVKCERILDNIVMNSIRYVPEQGTISIEADLSNDGIGFQITDTGKGFSNKDLSNLFSKFYRGDEARSSRDGHAGLGLYIAQKLVEMHGGTIAASNTKEGGACIKFNLLC